MKAPALYVACCALIAAPALSQRVDPIQQPSPSANTSQPIEGLSLRRQMVSIQAALSRIAANLAKPEQLDQTLLAVEDAQRRVIEAKKATPPRFDDIEDQTKHDRAYRATMARALAQLATLEMALLEGDDEKARSTLGQLASLREQGHLNFQRPRGPREPRRVEMTDAVTLTPAQRKAYIGVYEFKDVGFQVTVAEREGALYLETFGQDPERIYAMGDHRFRIAVAANAVARFEIGKDGVATAIILDAGADRPEQRIERVR